MLSIHYYSLPWETQQKTTVPGWELNTTTTSIDNVILVITVELKQTGDVVVQFNTLFLDDFKILKNSERIFKWIQDIKWVISLKTTNLNLMVVLEKKSEAHQCDLGSILSTPWISVSSLSNSCWGNLDWIEKLKQKSQKKESECEFLKAIRRCPACIQQKNSFSPPFFSTDNPSTVSERAFPYRM